MIRTIIFDLGNVLAWFDHSRTTRAFAPENHLELHKIAYGNALEESHDAGRIDTPNFVAEVISRAGLNCTQETFLHHFADIFSPNREILDLIPDLSTRYRLLIASNTNAGHRPGWEKVLEPWLSYFYAVIVSYQIGHRKPELAFYEAVQRQALGERQECIFVDDLPANIAASIVFGWHGLLYSPGVDLKAALKE